LAKKRLEAVVIGKVQGVGFRNYVLEKGTKLGLCGYAKNLSDGTVEIIAEGDLTRLVDFLSAIVDGPMLSRVDRVKKNWAEHTGTFANFSIR